MARPLRIDVEGGWYHVFSRGLNKQEIFPNEHANLQFIALLSKMPQRFDIRIHAYVLMGNHYHLQVETPKANLSQAIQWLNVSYSGWYNRLNRRVGPLFQGRFKAVLHERDSAGLIINRYIHLNPVRVSPLGGHEGRMQTMRRPGREVIKARIAALNHRWSSYSVYVGNVRHPGWITTESIYKFFGDHTSHSLRGAYRRQLEEMAALGNWETDWRDQVSATVLLGSEMFVGQMTRLLKGKRNEQIGLRQVERSTLDWSTICEAVSSVWKQEWLTLSTARGNGAVPAAWYFGRHFASMRLGELGGAVGDVSYPAVSAAIGRFEKRLKVDRELQKKVKAVRGLLKI